MAMSLNSMTLEVVDPLSVISDVAIDGEVTNSLIMLAQRMAHEAAAGDGIDLEERTHLYHLLLAIEAMHDRERSRLYAAENFLHCHGLPTLEHRRQHVAS